MWASLRAAWLAAAISRQSSSACWAGAGLAHEVEAAEWDLRRSLTSSASGSLWRHSALCDTAVQLSSLDAGTLHLLCKHSLCLGPLCWYGLCSAPGVISQYLLLLWAGGCLVLLVLRLVCQVLWLRVNLWARQGCKQPPLASCCSLGSTTARASH